ncbi:peroxiredoxin [Pontiella sp.]|uniref:peroxiredoxin n=1 Tax=Pontiella sp. TaxID=2837462 RepID=UPI003566FD8A
MCSNFYPKDGTTGCTLEAKDFTALLPRFHKLNAEVLGVSEDSSQSHCDFIAEHELKLVLLSDPDHKVMEQYGAWVVSSFGSLTYGRAIRTTMIIDPAGIIRHYMPEVMPQGHAGRVLEKLEALQSLQ